MVCLMFVIGIGAVVGAVDGTIVGVVVGTEIGAVISGRMAKSKHV